MSPGGLFCFYALCPKGVVKYFAKKFLHAPVIIKFDKKIRRVIKPLLEQTRKLYKYTEGMDERNLLERDVREWAAPFGLLLDNVVSCFSSFTGTPDRGDHPFAAHDFPAG